MLSINELLSHASTQGYKSNVLKPLIYICAIGFIMTILFFKYEITFFGYLMGSITTLSFIGLIGAYFYCLVKNPDLLRSERYNIEQSLIKKVKVIGDSTNAKFNLPPSNYIMIEGKNDKINEE